MQRRRSNKSAAEADAKSTSAQEVTPAKPTTGGGHGCTSTGPLVPVLLFFACIASLTARSNEALPTPLASDASATLFSEARAREHVRALTALGVRAVGSRANEEAAPALLLRLLAVMEEEAAAAGAANFAKVSVQRTGAGAYSSAFLDGFTNVYDNVTNVLVFCGPRGGAAALTPRCGLVLEPVIIMSHRCSADTPPDGLLQPSPTCPLRDRVLLGAHYDSALKAPAASDDTAMVGVLLEAVRTLLAGPRLERGVVFNLNGAEETNWMGAHGFVSGDHEWAKGLRVVLNLEAVGSGGRDHILQVGPLNHWIAQAYAAAAPRPHSTSIVQEVFEIPGAIPGQTDFQVYRDYGGCVGIELVWLSRGELYHTVNDVEAAIPPGALQHTGENVLGLLGALLADPRLDTATKEVCSHTSLYFTRLY